MTKLVKPYSQVVCYYLTTNFLPALSRIFDPVFWGPDILQGPALASMRWWLTLFPAYLDANRDGKGSIQEFYDVKVVQVLRIIFDGLDANRDGLVQQKEARLNSFLRPIFLRSLTQELFDYLDNNNDNQISVADITRCEIGGSSFCSKMDSLENKTVDNCHRLGSPLQHVCTTLMTAYFSPEFDM